MLSHDNDNGVGVEYGSPSANANSFAYEGELCAGNSVGGESEKAYTYTLGQFQIIRFQLEKLIPWEVLIRI